MARYAPSVLLHQASARHPRYQGLKLLKISTLVIISFRFVNVASASSDPWKRTFVRAFARVPHVAA
jgi:hypothetical protein